MADNPNISELEATLQEHISDNEAIFEEKFVPLDDMLDKMQVFDNVHDKQPLLNLEVNDPNQPGNRSGNNGYEPKSDILNWKNRMLVVDHGEITFEMTQAKINALWQSYLAKIHQSPRRGNVYDVPFEDYMISRTIARSADQLRKKGIWKGVKNASGTTSADIMDGLLTKIAADIVDGDIPASNVFAGAPITTSNAVAQVEGLVDIIASNYEEYMDEPLTLYMSPANARKYMKNYQTLHDALPYNTEFKKVLVEGLDNCEICPEIGLSGSDRMVITPNGNLGFGTDAAERRNNIIVEREKRNLIFLVDFKVGVEYGLSQLMIVNDQT